MVSDAIEADARRDDRFRETGELAPPFDFVSQTLSAYRAQFDPSAADAELGKLKEEHDRLMGGWADLPTDRAKGRARERLAALETRMDDLERQRNDLAETVEATYREIADLHRAVAEAEYAMRSANGARAFRHRAESLGGCSPQSGASSSRGRPPPAAHTRTAGAARVAPGYALAYKPPAAGGTIPAVPLRAARMDRREFLAVAAAATAAPLPAEDTPAMIPVIDTHQHLWDLSKFKLSWLKPGSEYDHSFTPKEYAAATAGLNVVKAVYMEVDVVPEQQQAEADYLIELCKSGTTPTRAAVVSGRPAGDDFDRYAGQFKGSKYVKGVRQVLHVDSTPPGYCLDPKFVKGIQLLGDLGLSFDLCVRPAELPNYVKLVERCPGTRFILDHCGNPQAKFTPAQTEQWKKDTAALAAKPGVMCKVSGFLANGYEKGKWTAAQVAPVVNHILDTFGPDRVMFGGDWPVVLAAATYKEWLTALREIVKSRPEADQKKLFHDNAAKFYGI